MLKYAVTSSTVSFMSTGFIYKNELLYRYLESGAVAHLLCAHAQQEGEILVLQLWVAAQEAEQVKVVFLFDLLVVEITNTHVRVTLSTLPVLE
jgi:hypothetical protein